MKTQKNMVMKNLINLLEDNGIPAIYTISGSRRHGSINEIQVGYKIGSSVRTNAVSKSGGLHAVVPPRIVMMANGKAKLFIDDPYRGDKGAHSIELPSRKASVLKLVKKYLTK